MLDDPHPTLVAGAEPDERFVQSQQLLTSRRRGNAFLQAHQPHACAALERLTTAGGIHQHLSHRPCGHREEVGAALPLLLSGGNQLQVGLVYQRGSAQRFTRAPLPHLAREAAQLPVHPREEYIVRLAVASACGVQQLRHAGLARGIPRKRTHQLNNVVEVIEQGRGGFSAASA